MVAILCIADSRKRGRWARGIALARSSKRSATDHQLSCGNERAARDVPKRLQLTTCGSMYMRPKADTHLVCAEATASPRAVPARAAKLVKCALANGHPASPLLKMRFVAGNLQSPTSYAPTRSPSQLSSISSTFVAAVAHSS